MAPSRRDDSSRDLAMNGRLHVCVAGLLAALVVACSASATPGQVTNPHELKPVAYLSAGPVSAAIAAGMRRARSRQLCRALHLQGGRMTAV